MTGMASNLTEIASATFADVEIDIERDPDTDLVTYEQWRRIGNLHREGGPAYIERDPATGVTTYEVWARNDDLHREDGPAFIERDPVTGVAIYEEWWRNGARQEAPRRAPAPDVLRP